MQKRKRNKLWLVLAILLLALAMIFGFFWLRRIIVERDANRLRDELVKQANATVTKKKQEPKGEEKKPWDKLRLDEKYAYYKDKLGIDVPRKNLNFKHLENDVNKDIYAWIYVPGSSVDDPVLQSPTDNSYYLSHTVDHKKGFTGAIYTEHSWNKKDFSDRMTVIYGHAMFDGRSFGTLHNFTDKAVFDKNRYIFIYTPDDILVYKIFAAYDGNDSHIIYSHDWNDTSWVQYLDDTLKTSGPRDNHIDSYHFTKNDKVVTLSTCIRNRPNDRYLIQGVLVR